MASTRNLDSAVCSKDKSCAQRLGELVKFDVDDAVKLSIAASEALVIHELVKSDQLEGVSILEAALNLSKARLESFCYTLHCPDKDIDQSDSFPDFGDSVMLEAFQDVGLQSSIHEGEPNCHVNVFEGGNCSHSESHDDNGGIRRHSNDNFVQDDYGKLPSGRMTSGSRGVKDPALCDTSEEISEFTPPNKDSTNVLEELWHIDGQGIISRPLVGETSFFSESEDTAIDKCSLEEKHEGSCRLVSQSSLHRFCERADEVVSSIQDEGSYNLSQVDQLCSIVPCSIPPENGVPFFALDQNTIGLSETCFGSTENHNKECLHRFPGVEIQSLEGDGQAVPPFLIGFSQSSFQRHSAWMKNYSRPALKASAVTCAESKNLPSLLPFQSMVVHHTAIGVNENQKNHNDNPEMFLGEQNLDAYHSPKSLQKVHSGCEHRYDTQFRARKRVRFSEIEVTQYQEKASQEHQGFTASRNKTTKFSGSRVLGKYLSSHGKYQRRSVFRGMEFLLTGFAKSKQKKIEELIRKHGGKVLQEVPSHSNPNQRRRSKAGFQLLPIILCPRKLQTTKFLYGCAVKTLILKPKWVTDFISVGSAFPIQKYMILPNQSKTRFTRSGKPYYYVDTNHIFDGVGFLLCGKRRFCTQLAIIIKHGGGYVFRSLHSMIQSKDTEKIHCATIVSEDESRVSRHLRQCALEREINVMPASWIVKSLHSGSLLQTTS